MNLNKAVTKTESPKEGFEALLPEFQGEGRQHSHFLKVCRLPYGHCYLPTLQQSIPLALQEDRLLSVILKSKKL